MLTYWSTRLCSRWRRDLSQRSNCWGFVFLLLWSVFFSHIVNSGFRLSGLRAFRSFGLKFRFAFCSPLVTADRWSTVCPCEFDCGARYCQFVYILCAGRRHQQLFNLRVLSRTKNVSLLVSLMAILPFEPHTLTLFKTKIADFLTLFKTEFRFLISCLRHLTRNHTLCKTIINIETFSYLIHWQSQNYLKRYPFKTKNDKLDTLFKTKIPKNKKHTLAGRTSPLSPYKGLPPLPPSSGPVWRKACSFSACNCVAAGLQFFARVAVSF